MELPTKIAGNKLPELLSFATAIEKDKQAVRVGINERDQ